MSPSSERTRARLEALRQAPGEVAVVAYTEQELAEREALAAAKALGRAWRRRAPRSVRVKLLGRLGVPMPELASRSIVDALLKQTLSGGFRVTYRAEPTRSYGWMSSDLVNGLPWTECRCDDHEPFELTRRIPSRAPDARRSD